MAGVRIQPGLRQHGHGSRQGRTAALLADLGVFDFAGGIVVDITAGVAAVGVVVYTILVSYGILEVVDATVGLRVEALDEDQGLDVVLHEEAGYRF